MRYADETKSDGALKNLNRYELDDRNYKNECEQASEQQRSDSPTAQPSAAGTTDADDHSPDRQQRREVCEMWLVSGQTGEAIDENKRRRDATGVARFTPTAQQ